MARKLPDKFDRYRSFQFTKEQAIQIYDSGIWKNWSLEQIAGFQLYQKRLCVPFGKFHEAVEHVLGRPVWTHEFGMSYAHIVEEYEQRRRPPTLSEIISLIPPEKLIVVGVENGE